MSHEGAIGIDLGGSHATLAIRPIDRDRPVVLGTRRWNPEDTADRRWTAVASVLSELITLAERETATPVSNAVIAVPGHFATEQRHRIEEAARAAGIRFRLVTGGAAAAVAYGSRQDEGSLSYWLVYSLGGRTFEVSVLRVEGRCVEVIATAGDPSLGGRDFDAAIADWATERLLSLHGIDVRDDSQARASLLRSAEDAKKRLSGSEKTWLDLSSLRPESPIELRLTRPEFEALIEDRVRRTLALTDSVVRSAEEQGAPADALDAILLTGGSSKIPCIKRTLADWSGRGENFVKDRIDPETVVACGAAILALDAETTRSASANDLRVESRRDPRPVAAPADAATSYGAADEPAATTKPRILDEDVEFTVFRPRVLRPAEWRPLLAFAHLSESPPDADPEEPEPAEEVQRIARQLLGDQEIEEYKQSVTESRVALPREGELKFVPHLPGFDCNPPRHSFLWLEPVHRAEFRIRARPEIDGTTVAGKLSVFLGSILVAEAPLRIRVDGHFLPAKRETPERAATRPFKKIFASYSHRDLQVVEEFERFFRAIGDEYLRDWRNLRAGEEWNPRLMEMIREADVFQLFWSTNSMKSAYVRQEWEYALSLKRQSFVRPCYWESPMPTAPDLGLPTPSLRSLHFHRLESHKDSWNGKLETIRHETLKRDDSPMRSARWGIENSATDSLEPSTSSSADREASRHVTYGAANRQEVASPQGERGAVPADGALEHATDATACRSPTPQFARLIGPAVADLSRASGRTAARMVQTILSPFRRRERSSERLESRGASSSSDLARLAASRPAEFKEATADGESASAHEALLRSANLASDGAKTVVAVATVGSALLAFQAGAWAASLAASPAAVVLAAALGLMLGSFLPWVGVIILVSRRKAARRRFLKALAGDLAKRLREGDRPLTALKDARLAAAEVFPHFAQELSVVIALTQLGKTPLQAWPTYADRTMDANVATLGGLLFDERGDAGDPSSALEEFAARLKK